MEARRDPSREEIRKWHREWLAGELTDLGPARFIEGLRVMKQAHELNVGVDLIGGMLEERGISSNNERQMHFMVGYQADQAEWNEILGLMERK